ncbi:hypothetical protein KAT73_06015, partial [candidate division WOR-3 bacterium]|nr:hypothetical protein [candidate division WOR-3 bacterium]
MKESKVVCYMGILLLASVVFGANMMETPRSSIIGKAVMQVDDRDVLNETSNYSHVIGSIHYGFHKVAVGEIDTIGSTTYDWQYNGP